MFENVYLSTNCVGIGLQCLYSMAYHDSEIVSVLVKTGLPSTENALPRCGSMVLKKNVHIECATICFPTPPGLF